MPNQILKILLKIFTGERQISPEETIIQANYLRDCTDQELNYHSLLVNKFFQYGKQ
mgnify:CR=1 FL=1